MKEKNIKQIVADNIIRYRKQAGLTQAALAEKIHYSDKAVSKWERGESLPDVIVLKDIADVLNVDIDDMLHEETAKEKFKTFYRNRTVIAILSVILAFFVFMIATVVMQIVAPELPNWLLMVYSIPAAFIVALVFNSMWGGRLYNMIIVSGLAWSLTLSLVLSLEKIEALASSIWELYFVTGIFQVMIILWYMIVPAKKKNSGYHEVQEDEVKEKTETEEEIKTGN